MPWKLDVDEYRSEAARCRRLAGEARLPVERAQWLAVAAEFEALVESVQKLRFIKIRAPVAEAGRPVTPVGAAPLGERSRR